ncbi:hypothetical protein FHG87_006796, partial [Trinorchestia longiramus]
KKQVDEVKQERSRSHSEEAKQSSSDSKSEPKAESTQSQLTTFQVEVDVQASAKGEPSTSAIRSQSFHKLKKSASEPDQSTSARQQLSEPHSVESEFDPCYEPHLHPDYPYMGAHLLQTTRVSVDPLSRKFQHLLDQDPEFYQDYHEYQRSRHHSFHHPHRHRHHHHHHHH